MNKNRKTFQQAIPQARVEEERKIEEDKNEDDQKMEEEIKPKRKLKTIKFDEQRLMDQQIGMKRLYLATKDFHFSNNPLKDLNKMVNTFNNWHFGLMPKYDYSYFLERIQHLGSKNAPRNYINQLRKIHKGQLQFNDIEETNDSEAQNPQTTEDPSIPSKAESSTSPKPTIPTLARSFLSTSKNPNITPKPQSAATPTMGPALNKINIKNVKLRSKNLLEAEAEAELLAELEIEDHRESQRKPNIGDKADRNKIEIIQYSQDAQPLMQAEIGSQNKYRDGIGEIQEEVKESRQSREKKQSKESCEELEIVDENEMQELFSDLDEESVDEGRVDDEESVGKMGNVRFDEDGCVGDRKRERHFVMPIQNEGENEGEGGNEGDISNSQTHFYKNKRAKYQKTNQQQIQINSHPI